MAKWRVLTLSSNQLPKYKLKQLGVIRIFQGGALWQYVDLITIS